jgi:hypothetical protein
MAYPAREVNKFRSRVQTTVNNMREISEVLAIIDNQGADDTARAAFFDDAFGAETDNPDITFNQFVAGITALRAVKAAADANIVAIAALLQ